MKKYILTALLVLTPFVANATPSSIDRITDHIEPLIKSDYFQASYLKATSTTATSTFAGYVMIGSSTPMAGNGMFGIATSSRALYWSQFVNKVTGIVSFGTSSPTATDFFTVIPPQLPPEPGDFPFTSPYGINITGATGQTVLGTGSIYGLTAGSAGGGISLTGGAGGTANNTNGVNMLFGGSGGSINITSGAGATSNAPLAATNYGGPGGSLFIYSGAGGAANTGTIRAGGRGGTFEFRSGAGGGGFSTQTGGAGGTFSFLAGAGGLGSVQGGAGGSFDFSSGQGGEGYLSTPGAAGNLTFRSGDGGNGVTGANAGTVTFNGFSQYQGKGGNGSTGNGGAGSTVVMYGGLGGNSTAGGNAGAGGGVNLIAGSSGTGGTVPRGASVFLRPGSGSTEGIVSLGCASGPNFPMACRGNVAVGTTSAFAKLSLQNAFGSTTVLFDIATTTGANGAATSSLFKVDHIGNVTAGASTATSTFAGYMMIGSSTPGVGNAMFGVATTSQALFWSLFVDKVSGFVGVGTTSPVAMLHVNPPKRATSTSAVKGISAFTLLGGEGSNNDAVSAQPGQGGDISMAAGAAGTVINPDVVTSFGNTGGNVTLTAGAGSSGVGTTTTAVLRGGAGGSVTTRGGAGGVITGPSSGTRTGGNGGAVQFFGGTGGSAVGSTGTGGGGGGMSFNAGAGASGPTGGPGGQMTFQGAAGGTGSVGAGGNSSSITFGFQIPGSGVTAGGNGGNMSIGSGLDLAAGKGGSASAGNGGNGSGIHVYAGNGGDSSGGGNSGLPGTVGLAAGSAGTGGVIPNGGNVEFLPGRGTYDGSVVMGCAKFPFQPVICRGSAVVGTSTAFAKLSVQNFFGSTTPLFDIATTTAANGAATSTLFNVQHNGNVGIATSSPGFPLAVIGKAFFDTGTTANSNLGLVASSSSSVAGNRQFALYNSSPTATSPVGIIAKNIPGNFSLFDIYANPGASYVNTKFNIAVADSSKVLQDRLTIDVAGAVSATNFVSTSTTATSTFVGGVDLNSSRVKQHVYPSFIYATSTWTGTTTIPLGPAFVSERWNGIMCFTDTGTLNVSVYDGTNRMDLLNASTTVGNYTYSTNNTFDSTEKRYVDIGTPASSPTRISCTVDKTMNP